ncbi:MAG: alanine racemase [Nitrospinae bacterium]|nr:alanine racemase [Nitrospinota bacterium]
MHRATVAEVHVSNLRHNVQALRSLLQPGVRLMAVVKADAYGHGAGPCTRAVLEAGADTLGVGILAEGIELRELGIKAPIQVLVGIFPDEADELIQHNLTTTLYSRSLAETLSQRAGLLGMDVGVHIKIDTGMGRLGVPPEQLSGLVEYIMGLNNVRIESVFTHLSSADDSDPEFTQNQIARLQSALEQLKAAKFNIPLAHCANSAALLQFPKSQFDLVRPGIALYGALPSPGLGPVVDALTRGNKNFPLRPVMQWKTRILTINSLPKGSPVSYGKKFVTQRDSKIATLPVGYADGLERLLTHNMQVLVDGHKVPQVGTICMDMCMVDVTDRIGVKEGDEVVLLGHQGSETITADEMAAQAGTIPYEILCGVGKRVPRIYIQ